MDEVDDLYVELRRELRQAGFYAPSTECMGSWQRITACSQGPPDYIRYNGRSFWIACVEGMWYVGTWGSWVYRIRDFTSVVHLAHDFLSADGTIGDFSSELKAKYTLVPVGDAERKQKLADERKDDG